MRSGEEGEVILFSLSPLEGIIFKMNISKLLLWPLRPLFGNNYKAQSAKYLSELCQDNSSILDVGCNDGRIADLLLQYKPSLSIQGLDIQANSPCSIDRIIYDGKHFPFEDNSFDYVIAVDMLHHSLEIGDILSEMARVSKHFVLIKDVVIYSKLSHYFLVVADYLSNVKYGIHCPNNFPTWAEWHKYFKQANLEIITQPQNLSFGYGLNERYNPIFKLKKIS